MAGGVSQQGEEGAVSGPGRAHQVAGESGRRLYVIAQAGILQSFCQHHSSHQVMGDLEFFLGLFVEMLQFPPLQHDLAGTGDSLDQVFSIDGLGKVTVDADFDGLEEIGLVVEGGGDDHRRVPVHFLDGVGHLQAVHDGHLDVRDHHVGPVAGEEVQAFLTVRCQVQFSHPPGENLGHHGAGQVVVLHIEDGQ